MENMYYICCGRLQQDIDEECESAEIFGHENKIVWRKMCNEDLNNLTCEGFVCKLTEKVKKN